MVAQQQSWDKSSSSPRFTIKSGICTTRLFKNESFLRQKYEVEGLSARQIAFLIGSSHNAVNRSLDYYKIKRRPHRGGWVEFGWKMKNGKRVPHVRQQNVIQQMKRWKDRGWSNRRIAERLNEREVSTPTGKGRWYGSNIGRILKNNE